MTGAGALLAAVLLAACGGGSSGTASPSGVATSGAATSPATSATTAVPSAGASGSGAPSPAATGSPTGTGGSASPTATCRPFGSTGAQGTAGGLELSTVYGHSMRVGTHPCYDRVVVEFRGTGPVPQWRAVYRSELVDDPSDQPVSPPLRGKVFLDVTFGAWDTGEPIGEPAFTGPKAFLPVGYPALREARMLGGFEGVSRVAMGLDEKLPYRVAWLKDPVRLVVDISTASR